MDRARDLTRAADEARTRRAMLHMLEDLQRDRAGLREASRNWSATVDAVGDAMMVHDAGGQVMRCNRAYAALAGMASPDIIGRPYWECFPKGSVRFAPRSPDTGGGTPGVQETEFRVESGEVYVSRACELDQGGTAQVLHLFADVTARRRVEQQVRITQDIAASKFLLDGDVEQLARQVTEGAAKATGVARANVWLFNEAEDELRCVDLYEAASGRHSSGLVLRESEFRNEFAALKHAPYVDANDALNDPRTRGYVEGYLKPLGITSMLDTVVAVSGKHIGLLCLEHVGGTHRWQPDEIAFATHLADKVAVALSNRLARQAERDLRASEERHRVLFESSKDAFMLLSPLDGKFVSVNPATLAMFGAADPAEFASKGPWDVSPERQPDGRLSSEKAAEMIGIALRGGNHFFDWTHRRLDGTVFPATVLLTRLQLDDKTLVNATVRDVTELRRAQDSLEGRERFYRKVLDGSSDAFFVVDREAHLLYRSGSGEHLTGYDAADVMGKDLTRFLRPESLTAASQGLMNIIRNPEVPIAAELSVVRSDGSEILVEAVGRNLLADPDVQGVVVTARDITERKAGERALQASGETLRRTNRALRTLSAGNEALVRAADEASLLREMTRILHEVGGYPICLVGYARDDADKSVEIMAATGLEPDAVARLQLSWGDSDGQSVTGRAIRDGKSRLQLAATHSPDYARWHERMLAWGIGATVGMPLRFGPDQPPFGAIALGAREGTSFDAEELKLLEELAGDLAYGIFNLRTAVERRQAVAHLRASLEGAIGAIGATMEARDPYTAGHQNRVGKLGAAIAREMGLSPHQVEGIQFGGMVHDVGKIQVPAEILSKPARLTRIEFEMVKVHPQAGYDIVKNIEFPWPIALMVLQHHERLDGSGYPQGLKGDQIVLEAQILAVADVVEAMSSHRPYRPGLGIEAALKEIQDKRGNSLNPQAVDACLRLFHEKGYVL